MELKTLEFLHQCNQVITAQTLCLLEGFIWIHCCLYGLPPPLFMHLYYCIKLLIKSGQVNLCWWLEVGISATGKGIILGGTSCSCLNHYLCLRSHSINHLNQTFLGGRGGVPRAGFQMLWTKIIKEIYFPSFSSMSKAVWINNPEFKVFTKSCNLLSSKF